MDASGDAPGSKYDDTYVLSALLADYYSTADPRVKSPALEMVSAPVTCNYTGLGEKPRPFGRF